MHFKYFSKNRISIGYIKIFVNDTKSTQEAKNLTCKNLRFCYTTYLTLKVAFVLLGVLCNKTRDENPSQLPSWKFLDPCFHKPEHSEPPNRDEYSCCLKDIPCQMLSEKQQISS